MFSKKIGKILSKLTKSCQKSQKLTEISQKMPKVGDFTANFDFIERKAVKCFPFLGVWGNLLPQTGALPVTHRTLPPNPGATPAKTYSGEP